MQKFIVLKNCCPAYLSCFFSMIFLFVPATSLLSGEAPGVDVKAVAAYDVKMQLRQMLAAVQEPSKEDGLYLRYSFEIAPKDSAEFKRQTTTHEIVYKGGRSLIRSDAETLADDSQYFVAVSHRFKRILVREYDANSTKYRVEDAQKQSLLRDSLLMQMRLVSDEMYDDEGAAMRRVVFECPQMSALHPQHDCAQIEQVTVDWVVASATIRRMRINYLAKAETPYAWAELRIHELDYYTEAELEPALNQAFSAGKLREELAGYELVDLRREAR